MKKVRWGVIAAGGIADRRTIPGMMLADNAELVAVMEINMELAEKIRAKYNAKRAYDSAEALLADPEIDAVYIASPVNYHKDQAIAAARAKKHILIEKPICMTVEDGEEVLRICKEEGVKIATGLMMRYHAYHQVMKKFVDEGKLGQLTSIRGQFTCWYPDIPGAWRQIKSESGGGALVDLGVHAIDLIQYIAGSKAKVVAGMSDTKVFNYEVDDQASTLMELENGAYAYVDVNFNIPDAAAICRLEFYGTRGSMRAEGTLSQVEGGTLTVLLSDEAGYDAQQNRNDVEPVEVNVEFGNMYTKEIESFGRSILDGQEIEVPAEDAIQVQKVMYAAYESAEKKKFIEL
ncbi:MAG: Gfo/Idh/MocA family oxidoreductase [Clostridia bacterium]|nr:Gfo/Idh/MocA family oxidoreductase [Clostridia bacterium]